MKSKSLVEPGKIPIHFDRVDVPGHLAFGKRSDPPKVFEKLSRHFIIKIVEALLDISLSLLNDLNDVLSILRHILLKLELLADVLLLVELHIARLEEMGADGDSALNDSLPHHPLRHPLPCVEVAQLHILPSYPDMHVQRFLRQTHKY